MGKVAFMKSQIEEKLNAGYNCIKIKIGAIDFEQEIKLLRGIRERFSTEKITLRVDANGAFSVDGALKKLESLAQLDIHSIEQPIKAGQAAAMMRLCDISPLPIALDEELIGLHGMEAKRKLLETIRPHFIILKPTLLGGIGATREWIGLAEELGIGWWMTSALESNVGLNAIAQFTSTYQVNLPQGLGTGQLYHNNFPSPLKVEEGMIYYDALAKWGELD